MLIFCGGRSGKLQTPRAKLRAPQDGGGEWQPASGGPALPGRTQVPAASMQVPATARARAGEGRAGIPPHPALRHMEYVVIRGGGVATIVRATRGADIMAACGQLHSTQQQLAAA